MSFRDTNKKILNKLSESALRSERNKTVRAITEGLVNLIPIVLIGTICLAVGSLPIPAFHDFLNGVTLGNWTLISNIIIFSTEDIIALAALLSVSHSLAARNSFLQKREIALFFPMFTAFACYVILFVWDPVSYAAIAPGQSAIALFSDPGRNGVFGALFVAVLSHALFVLFAKLWQRLPWGHWRVLGSHQQVLISIRTVFPMAFTLVCFIALNFFSDWLFTSTGIVERISGAVSHIVSEGSLYSVIVSVLLMQAMWFFGAHGSNTIHSLMDRLEASSSADAAMGAAHAMDPSAMFTNSDFFSTFVDMGGTGTSLALLLALLIFGSAIREKRLARVSIFPGIFNINETLVFGVPVVLNPFLLIPFVLAPVVSVSVAYGAFSLGIVPPMTQSVEWTTPILISGYLTTGSIAGSVLQLVCVGLGFLVYAPFVIATRSITEIYQLRQFDLFKAEASSAANDERDVLATRYDSIGEMARDFIAEITLCFDEGAIPFYMVYQPKTDAQGRVVGAEALLRWKHQRFGPIPPDVLIELADEADLSTPLGRWITTQALEEQARWRQKGLSGLVVSINLNPHHVFADDEFPEFLEEEIKRLGLEPAHVELEITEHVAVRASTRMLEVFKKLRDLGVKLSIDDMGMGYSSLTYISDFGVSVVKIDISLIDKVAVDSQQQEIVRSVIELARQIDLAVIVEGVEEREQVETLVGLGCKYFQGYYFARPLVPEDFFAYVEKHGTTRLEREGKAQRL